MRKILPTELILNEDGSVYHLNLLPEDIANTIVIVGDPERVKDVSKYFDSIEIRKTKREFIIHTGYLNKKRITCLSTGMGTDNIDIVLNELDALVNINLKTYEIKPVLTTLNIIRIGTSGTVQKDIDVDSFLVSEYAIGLDGLMGFYEYNKTEEEKSILHSIENITSNLGVSPYVFKGNNDLMEHFCADMLHGITVTNAGFYGPQGRQVRLKPKNENYIDELANLEILHHRKITNLEMETAGIYGLSALLNHKAISCNAILANRPLGIFTKNANKTVDALIQNILSKI